MGQPNLNQMMQQVQKMQEDMAKAQEELKNEVVEASAGGGMVTVKISGEMELKELTIDPDAVDPEDVEMLQDMVQAAVNEGIRSAQELAASKMNAKPPMERLLDAARMTRVPGLRGSSICSVNGTQWW